MSLLIQTIIILIINYNITLIDISPTENVNIFTSWRLEPGIEWCL